MKLLNIIFIIYCLLAAALQYNDPDPYIWIPIYLYTAWVCYLATRNQYNRKLYITGIIIYLAYAVYFFFDKTGVLSWIKQHNSENLVQSMKATKPWIEETREFFGLLILILILSVNMIWLRKKNINRSI